MSQRKQIIFTNKLGKQYALLQVVVGENYIVPYDGSKYWEHHFVPRDTWIPMSEVNWDNFDVSEAEYNVIVTQSKKDNAEILAKYHASF